MERKEDNIFRKTRGPGESEGDFFPPEKKEEGMKIYRGGGIGEQAEKRVKNRDREGEGYREYNKRQRGREREEGGKHQRSKKDRQECVKEVETEGGRREREGVVQRE
jgi:hypothetical protein